jgi:hypothetical protein
MKTLLALSLIVLLGSPLSADELVMKDGKKYEFVTLHDAGDFVELELAKGGRIKLAKKDIEKVAFAFSEPKPAEPKAAPAAAPGNKGEVPPPNVAAEIKMKIEKDFEEDYKAAKAGRAGKKALSSKLAGAAVSAEPNDRYVLLTEAALQAAEALDPSGALTAFGDLVKSYPVKPEDLRTKLFEKVRAAKKAGDNEREIADVYLQYAERAMAADDYEQAGALAHEAQHPKVLANPALYAGLVSSLQQLIAEATETQKEYDRFRAAGVKLEAGASDAAANLDRGRFLCFFKSDWTQGLRFLAAAGDKYAAAAGLEKAAPADASAQMELADAWFSLAQKEKDPYKRRVGARAVYWYLQAWDALSAPQQAKVEKSLAQAQELAGRVNLMLVKSLPKEGGWNVSGKGIDSPGTGMYNVMDIVYAPPPQFDLDLTVAGLNCGMSVGVVTPAMKLQVGFDANGQCGIGLAADKAKDAPKVQGPKYFAGGKTVKILIQVRAASVTVSLDGATILDWKGNPKDLALTGIWKDKVDPNSVFLSHHQNAGGGGGFKVQNLVLSKK